MIYYDLGEDVTDLMYLTGDTAWQVVSAAIEENRRGFPDTALVEVSNTLNQALVLIPLTLTLMCARSQGMWLQDTHCANGASQFDGENDRSAVTLGQVKGREGCVEVCTYSNQTNHT